jgi:hypothetical protein
LFTGKFVSVESNIFVFGISQYNGIPSTERTCLDKHFCFVGGGGGVAALCDEAQLLRIY